MPPVQIQTPEQRAAAYQAAGVPLPPAQYTSPTPAAPPTISADAITQPAQPLTMPTPVSLTPPDYYAGLIKSLPTPDSIITTRSTDQNNAVALRDNVTKQMMDVLAKVNGKSAAQIAAESAAGLPDLEKQLTDVNSQIRSLQNEASAIPLQVQNDAEGRGVTAGGVAPIQAAALRTNAIKALGLSSIAATLQGNVSLAQQQADRAVAAEFGPLQSELDYLKQIYSLNQDTLSEADKEQSARISSLLDERQNALNTAKTDRSSVFDLVQKAIQSGAPANVVSGALGMDLSTATKTLTPYLKTQNTWSEPYLLGGDYVQKNATTGEIRTAVNVPGGGGGGGGTPVTFSQTQLNKGAANAGVPIASFATLPADTKNWFINSYSVFQAQQKLIQTGERTAQEVANDVQGSSSIPEGVKPILLNILGVSATTAPGLPAQNTGGNWFTNSLQKLTGIQL